MSEDALVERLGTPLLIALCDWRGEPNSGALALHLARAVLPIVDAHAKAERKAGAVDALRDVRHESRGLIFAYRVRYLLAEHMALYGRRSRER